MWYLPNIQFFNTVEPPTLTPSQLWWQHSVSAAIQAVGLAQIREEHSVQTLEVASEEDLARRLTQGQASVRPQEARSGQARELGLADLETQVEGLEGDLDLEVRSSWDVNVCVCVRIYIYMKAWLQIIGGIRKMETAFFFASTHRFLMSCMCQYAGKMILDLRMIRCRFLSPQHM